MTDAKHRTTPFRKELRDSCAPPPQTLTQQKTQNAAQQKTENVDRLWSGYKQENVRNKNSGHHQEMEKCTGNEGGMWQRGKEKSSLRREKEELL